MKRKYRASLRNGASCEASQNCRSAFSLIGQPLRDRLPAQCVATTPVLVVVDFAAGEALCKDFLRTARSRRWLCRLRGLHRVVAYKRDDRLVRVTAVPTEL